MHKALFSEFAYPAFESFHEIKVVEVTRRQKSVACGQTLSEHSHKLKTYEWSEWIVCCGVSAGLPLAGDDTYEDIQSLSAACCCSIAIVPKILIGFVSWLQFAWCCQYLMFSCDVYYTEKVVGVCLQ